MTGTPKVASRANAPRLAPFLKALCSMLEDEGNKKTVSWTRGGQSFIILDEARFCRDVLPNYFKHNKLASFVRQANMYYFRKLSVGDTKWLEFAHEEGLFDRARPDLIWSIRRRPRDAGATQRQIVPKQDEPDTNSINSAILGELVDIVGEIARTMPKSNVATLVQHRLQVLAKTCKHQTETSGRGEKRAYLTSASSPASPSSPPALAVAEASPAKRQRSDQASELTRSLSITNYSVVEEDTVVSSMCPMPTPTMGSSMFFVDDKSDSQNQMSWQDMDAFGQTKPLPVADEPAAAVPLSPASDATNVNSAPLVGLAYDNPDGELFYGKAVPSKLNPSDAMPPSSGVDVVVQNGSDGRVTLRTSSMM